MAQMMSGDHPDEDRVSIKSNGKSLNGATKETLGQLRESFRQSFRRVGEKSPFSPNNKGSKVTHKMDSARNDLGSVHQQAPPSPTLSASSPMASPLKSPGGFFQKKEEDGNHSSPPATKKSVSRTQPDPSMALADSLLKRGASLRRSLGFGGKKVKAKTCIQEELTPANECLTEEKKNEGEEVCEEMEESYTLPEIPHTPLSVIQISKLIDKEELEEAHLNLLSLRLELQQEMEQCDKEDSPMNLAKKEKDLSLLYGDLREKVKAIVRDSNSFPSRNKGLLVHVARIIQEEDKRAGEPCVTYGPGGWMEAWVEAVAQGVEAKLKNIPLDSREQNVSWLSVHLGLLGKAIVEDLETVKKELRWSYPPSFKVFSTYVKSYHRAVGQHLKKLQQQVTELKDFYALLQWIIKDYQSDRIIGSTSLQPEMCECESTGLLLEDGFLDQLKEKYCCRMKEDMRSSLDKLIEMEIEDVWRDSKSPEMGEEDGFPSSKFPMDIWVKVQSNIKNSKQIDAQLEVKVISSCLEELKLFPKRFDVQFRHHCSTAADLWPQYQITYINSFTALQQHMEGYRDSCPEKLEDFREEVKWLIDTLTKGLEEQFKEHVKSCLRRMLTRKWLTNDDDFLKLYSWTEKLSQHCTLIRPPYAQELASQLHYHVVREYISQLMKNDYSCKNQKHEKAASKIREQLDKLQKLFEDMKSTHEWLHPLGDDLSDIIGQKNTRDIKDNVWSLVAHYPDISRKHLAAVLYFRGVVRGRERQQILEKLTDLKKDIGNAGDKSQVLFSDMQVIVNTNCLPFSCLSYFSA